MPQSRLLQRPHLDPAVRIQVGTAVALWHADWSMFEKWVRIGQQHQLDRRDFEENLLQCVLFCGFPRAITAWGTLDNTWPAEHPPMGGALPSSEQLPAGRKLFAAIYGKNDQPVRDMLQSHHGELHDFVLEAAYGRVLTRPHLPSKTRELVAVAVLAAMGQKRQFVGHARGAMHFGATREELHEVLVTTFDRRPEDAPEATQQVIADWLQRVR